VHAGAPKISNVLHGSQYSYEYCDPWIPCGRAPKMSNVLCSSTPRKRICTGTTYQV